MKVKEDIRRLQELEPETELIMTWFDEGLFDFDEGDEWNEFCHLVEDNYDWSDAYESIKAWQYI